MNNNSKSFNHYVRHSLKTNDTNSPLKNNDRKLQEGLAVASIAQDVVVEITPPAMTMRGKFGSEFETESYNAPIHFCHRQTDGH